MSRLRRYLHFGLAGTVGFLLDAAVVTLATTGLQISPVPAQIIAFSVAVIATWNINRRWTFSEHASQNWIHELARYVAANSTGAAVNNGTYLLLIYSFSLCASEPALAVAAGSMAGMIFNYWGSKKLVFRN